MSAQRGEWIAALYVETGGAYYGLPDVDPWDEARDARTYPGPWPVVAHPPCERWGRMWFGSPWKPDPGKYRLGDDGGCFEAALEAVRKWGGVLEHPEASHAWAAFGINKPPRNGGWITADVHGGWTCCVEQGHYGHRARKMTWLYAVGCVLPALQWGGSGQRLDPVLLQTRGYEYARRSGITGSVGGKWKKRQRAATPIPFRDVLLAMARDMEAGRVQTFDKLVLIERRDASAQRDAALNRQARR